jgi:HD-like signal output (HDOD) protein
MAVDAASILLARHEQLESRAGAAAKVMQLADDPGASAQDLARTIGADPLMAARVLRVANSAYYGLGGRVSTLPFAVSVLGFRTVRTLAVVAAAGLDDPGAAPEGFWRAAATCATACELVAPAVDADPGDAFSLGLMHTLGAALLHQHEPRGLLCLPEPDDVPGFLRLERDRYGISHDQAAARVLATWHFPDRLCGSVARHHELPLPDATPLDRSLHAARALTDRLLRGQPSEHDNGGDVGWLTGGRVAPADLPLLLQRVSERTAGLLEGLQPRR